MAKFEQKLGHDTVNISNHISNIGEQVQKLANTTIKVQELEKKVHQLETIRIQHLQQIENLQTKLEAAQLNVVLLKDHNVHLSKKSENCDLDLIKSQKRFDRLFYERDCAKQELTL